MNDPFKEIAERTHFNIYNSPMWNATGRRFAEAIVKECANIASNPAPGCHSSFGEIIKKHFGVEE